MVAPAKLGLTSTTVRTLFIFIDLIARVGRRVYHYMISGRGSCTHYQDDPTEGKRAGSSKYVPRLGSNIANPVSAWILLLSNRSP